VNGNRTDSNVCDLWRPELKFDTQKNSHHPCPDCDDVAAEVLCGANQANIYRSEAGAITATLIFAEHYPSSSAGSDGTVTKRLLEAALRPLGHHSFYIQLASLSPRTVSAPCICPSHSVFLPIIQSVSKRDLLWYSKCYCVVSVKKMFTLKGL
jgi:hypothetical protein